MAQRHDRGALAPPTAAGDVTDVRVWDGAVRVVHWALAILCVVLLDTGYAKGEWLAWHLRAGQAMLALVLFRLVWGFVGSRHARFAAFVRGPAQVLAYARSLASPPHAIHTGHNPLGGWMVVLLLVALLVQASLGLFTNDDVFTDGPLVRYVSKDLSDTLSSLHRRNAYVVIALVSLHVAAALGYLVAFRENLITPMVTGVKSLPRAHAAQAMGSAGTGRAIVLAIACALAVWLLVRRW
jgi:cytochrome b